MITTVQQQESHFNPSQVFQAYCIIQDYYYKHEVSNTELKLVGTERMKELVNGLFLREVCKGCEEEVEHE
jgi:hypothetical protein